MANREVVLELVDNPSFNPSGAVYYEQRNGVLKQSKTVFLDGSRPESASGSRRVELARFVTTSKSFPKAYVNRMWGHFFGRGFTNPIDDFGPQNEPSHPELLDELASAFENYGTDPPQAYPLDLQQRCLWLDLGFEQEQRKNRCRALLQPHAPQGVDAGTAFRVALLWLPKRKCSNRGKTARKCGASGCATSLPISATMKATR